MQHTDNSSFLEAFELVSLPLCIFDHQFRFLYSNSLFLKLFAKISETGINMDIDDFFSFFTSTKDLSIVKQKIIKDGAASITTIIKQKQSPALINIKRLNTGEYLLEITHTNFDKSKPETTDKHQHDPFKRAQNNLIADSEFFSSVCSNLPDVITITRATDGTYFLVNHMFEQTLEYKKEEIEGQSSIEFNIWADTTQRDEIIGTIRQKGEVQNKECCFITKSGKKIFGMMSAKIMVIKGIPYIVGVTRSINELKNVYLELHESEKRYKNILENMQDLFIQIDLEGTIIDVSQAVEKFIHASRSKIVGMKSHQFYNDPTEQQKLIEQLAINGQVSDYGIDIIDMNGKILHASVSARIVYDHEGNPKYHEALLRDTTRRKQGEKELQSNRDILKKLLDESTRFINPATELIDFQQHTDLIKNISGAKFCILMLYNEKKNDFNTTAHSGVTENLKLILSIMGDDILDRSWPSELLGNEIEDNIRSVHYNSFTELTKHVFPEIVAQTASNLLNLGKICVCNILSSNKVIGAFCLFFEKGNEISNLELINIYTIQLGLFIERERSERNLREREEKYRNLVMRIPDGVYKSTSQGQFLDVNPAMVNMLGYDSKEELMQINIVNDLYADPDDRSLDYINDHLNIKLFPLRKKDGSLLWVEDNGWYNYDENGIIVSHEGVLRDVSQRLKDEERLKKSEEKFRLLFDNNPQPMLIYDVDSKNILDVNKTAVDFYQYNKEELTSMNLSDLIHISQQEEVYNSIEKLKKRTVSFRMQMTQLKKSGEIVEVETFSSPIPYEGHNARQVMLNDITERLRAENALIKSEANLQEAMRLGNMAFWEYNADTDLFIFNDQFYSIYNTNVSEMGGYTMTPGEYISRFMLDEESEIVRGEMNKALYENNANYISQKEHKIRCSDGLIKHISVNSRISQLINNKTTRIVGVNQDISLRKATELKLEKSEHFFKWSQQAAHIGSYSIDFTQDSWESSEVLDDILGIEHNYNRSLNSWFELIHEDDKAFVKDNFRDNITNNQKHFDFEYRIKRATDKKICWVHFLGELICNAQEAISLAGTVQDISERKQTELELDNRMNDLLRFQRVTVGREMTMITLKKEVNDLLLQLGRAPKYQIVK